MLMFLNCKCTNLNKPSHRTGSEGWHRGGSQWWKQPRWIWFMKTTYVGTEKPTSRTKANKFEIGNSTKRGCKRACVSGTDVTKMWNVCNHTAALLMWSDYKQRKPSAQAIAAKRSTRKQCCSECVGGLRAQVQSQEKESQAKSGWQNIFLDVFSY